MPTILSDAYSILIDTIVNKKTHKHYVRVTELATLYKQLITGHEIDKLLKQFVRREDDDLFKQRTQLTHAITPAVSASIMTPFQKVGRVNSIVKKIDFQNTEDDKSKHENINEAILKFNGDKSLDRYLETRFVDLNFTDPNSFIITEFDNVPLGAQGEMTEMVQPRPFECSSEQAINFLYKNNILQWLIARLNITYKLKDDKEESGYSYTIYLEDNAIKFTQVDVETARIKIGEVVEIDTVGIDGKLVKRKYYRPEEKVLFLVEEFEYKAGRVPAIRVGYKMDLVTEGQTCVNPMHDAMPYFMKSIKTVSEFDLTMALHAFPQKFQYVNRCLGDTAKKISCDGGTTIEGGICNICHGSGWALHTSAQDAITMRMPKKEDEIFDLEKLVHYEYPPIELLKFQDEFIKELKVEALQAVFNSETFSKTTITQTATETNNKKDNAYDTLFPFAERFSIVYKYIVEIIARFRDIQDIIVEHRFPKDFKFKTVSELLAELQIANTSNAPGYIRQEISMDIAEQQFVDKPEELKRIRAKQRFFPFPDKTPTEILYIISNNKTSNYNEILWANFDNIFIQLEAEAEELELYFYDYAAKKQKELLDKKVQEFIDSIEEPEQAIPFENGGGN